LPRWLDGVKFEDRIDAGRRLGERLRYLAGQDVVVVGLARGGVPVAFEVAMTLGAPLDVIVVRKLGVPFQPELAMGAVGEDGVRVIDSGIVQRAGVDDDVLAAVERRERAELERQVQRFRRGRAAVPLLGRTVVVIDDGIATGATARAACDVVRARGALSVVLASPVGPPDAEEVLVPAADSVICLEQPADFYAVGQAFRSFAPTPDEEVADLLRRASDRAGPGPSQD
jgi:putative phosphoribosyl transferase